MKVLIILTILVVCRETYSICIPEVDPAKITLTLYNANFASGEKPFGLADLIPSEPIFVLFHGWAQDSISAPWIAPLRTSLIAKYPNSNVVVLDYGYYVKGLDYYEAWCKTPGIGEAIAVMFNDIRMSPALTRAIGFSLGANIAGYFARTLKALTSTLIASATALDQAGPGFDPSKSIPAVFSKDYLKSGDASKVVALYSNMDGFGMKEVYGDLNIFINDGEHQDCKIEILCALDIVTLNFDNFQPCFYCKHITARGVFLKAVAETSLYNLRLCDSFDNYNSCSPGPKLEAIMDTVPNGKYYIRVDKDYNPV